MDVSDASFMFIVCNIDVLSIGSVCLQLDMNQSMFVEVAESDREVYSTPIVLEEKGLTQMSTVDISLGVIFGICGAVILVAAAYYFWKNYQRRQRILRVFGQPHADPFEALHSSMEEESSIISL